MENAAYFPLLIKERITQIAQKWAINIVGVQQLRIMKKIGDGEHVKVSCHFNRFIFLLFPMLIRFC